MTAPIPPAGSSDRPAYDYSREIDDARRAAWREGYTPTARYSEDGTEFDPSDAEGL